MQRPGALRALTHRAETSRRRQHGAYDEINMRGQDTYMEAWRTDRLRWMTLEAAALKPDTDVRVQPETCHRRDAGPRPKLATNCMTTSTLHFSSSRLFS